MRKFVLAVAVLVLGSLGAGCALNKPELLPANDQVLIYPLPFDLAYLRVLEALESVDGWELQETEKEKGLITIRNLDFKSMDDADRRIARFVLKRLSRDKTSVQLAPESQRVIGTDAKIKAIGRYASSEL
jgi:hypothetical protein